MYDPADPPGPGPADLSPAAAGRLAADGTHRSHRPGQGVRQGHSRRRRDLVPRGRGRGVWLPRTKRSRENDHDPRSRHAVGGHFRDGDGRRVRCRCQPTRGANADRVCRTVHRGRLPIGLVQHARAPRPRRRSNAEGIEDHCRQSLERLRRLCRVFPNSFARLPHRPFHTGSRFSAKARGPSLASSEASRRS